MYLGIDIDCKLRFEDYADKIISKASQRMYIVKNFLYLRSRPLVCMLIDRFVVSLLSFITQHFSVFGKVRELARYIKYAFGLGGQTRPTKRWCPDGTPEGSNVSTCLIVNECGHIGERTLNGQFKTTTQKKLPSVESDTCRTRSPLNMDPDWKAAQGRHRGPYIGYELCTKQCFEETCPRIDKGIVAIISSWMISSAQ